MELAKAYVQIIPSANGISGSIAQAIGGEAESAGRSAGNKIASGIKTAIIAAGIGTALKKSISEAADLEQSLGGIETLFGASGKSLDEYARSVGKSANEVAGEYNKLIQAQETMIKYADQAYKTAGISANNYAETATSFAAALISSLDGDTNAAAEAANTAIIDMADNANKMGTAMESIQYAYQGFAKQNYTMLDNLKLGYGGTKTEMERLLADASEISGIEYNLDNLNDVYSAIHVIQEKLGITGTTAKEAAETLSGSFSSMKASASNFLANLALGRDIQPALSALVETTKTYLVDNLIPAVMNIVTTLPSALANLVGQLPSMIMTLVQTAAPQILTAAINMITQLRTGFVQNLPALLQEALPMILSFAENIRQNAGMLIDEGINLILELVNGLMEALPSLIEYVPQIITAICGVINDNMPKILAAAIAIVMMLGEGLIKSIPSIVSNMGNIVQSIISVISAINWVNVGTTILKGIASGIKSLATTPVTIIKNIGQNIVNVFKNGFSWKGLGTAIVDGIKNGLLNGANAIWDAAKSLASKALNAIKNFFGIHSPSRVFRDEVGKMLDYGLAEGITDNVNPIIDAMDQVAELTTNPISTEIETNVKNGTGLRTDFGRTEIDRDRNIISELHNLLDKAQFNGNIVIPVYIGQERIDEIVVNANKRRDYRSGGR